MKGHADYARRGQDIVCASASAVLLYTQMMLEDHTGIEGVIEPGDASLYLTFPNQDTHNILINFEMFVRQLQKQYPKHIKVHGGMLNDKIKRI